VYVGVVLDARSSDVAVQRDVSIHLRVDPDRLRIRDILHPIGDQVRMRFTPNQRTAFHHGDEAAYNFNMFVHYGDKSSKLVKFLKTPFICSVGQVFIRLFNVSSHVQKTPFGQKCLINRESHGNYSNSCKLVKCETDTYSVTL